jgi:hypothetical protein
MKKILIIIWLLVFFAVPAMAGERMSNDEMKVFYSGKTLTTIHFKNGLGKTYFGADGTAHSKSDDGKERIGKWWIDEEQNMRCVRWNSRDTDFCRYTEKNDDGTHTLIKPENGKRLVEFTGSADGNQL